MFKKEKLTKLKNKETDEWALIAKYNHYKSCLEKKNQLVKERFIRQNFTDTLKRQFSEKNLAKKNLQLLEEKFVNQLKENT